ncbi:hypothetical protein INR49_002243 [Caranx melampygus]|nr:hypothetical protein INR49_002243 [Caranx melampygus]
MAVTVQSTPVIFQPQHPAQPAGLHVSSHGALHALFSLQDGVRKLTRSGRGAGSRQCYITTGTPNRGGRTSTINNSSSVILERRDVKPDEDVGISKSMALVVRGEGGPHHPDSYSTLQDGGGGRLGFASPHCSAPPTVPADVVDSGVAGISAVLHQYRGSIKPLMGYGESTEHPTHSLHRRVGSMETASCLPLGTNPASSPHRLNEVRMIDGVGPVSPERMSPVRRSLRRDSNGATVDIVNRSRGSVSSSSTSSVFVDSPMGQPDQVFQGHVTASNAQSERMKAMEEQIASLAGLVHHALSMGVDIPGVKDTVSESSGRKLFNSRPVSSEPQNPNALTDSISPAPLALQAPPSDNGLQQSLVLAKRSVSELRLQLSQLRHLQLLNQESVTSILRMAGQELVGLMCERLAQCEEAAYRRRTEMEEERIHYLATEDRILSQLSPGQLSITLRDVEEGAVSLRRVGEALAILKGEFPKLQGKMRSVLGWRCVSESTPPGKSAQVEPLKVQETDQGPLKTQSPKFPPNTASVLFNPLSKLPSLWTEVSLGGSASPIMTRRMQHQPQLCSPPTTPAPH